MEDTARDNRDTGAATEYHELTKHSPASIRLSAHRLDWPNKPLLFKTYRGLPSSPLPRDFSAPTMGTLKALSPLGEAEDAFTLRDLSRLLYFAAGITKKAIGPSGEDYHFRAAASAGALYPVEVYLVTGDLPGLPAGIYHFAPREFALTRLREGDFRPHLARVTQEQSLGSVNLVFTSIFWRSAWKYQARSYRYAFWDTGTILANLLATATATGVRARVLTGFLDGGLNRLLGIDGEGEASLCVVSLGPREALEPDVTEPNPLQVDVEPLSRETVGYPEIRELHEASSLHAAEDLRSWKGADAREEAEWVEASFPLEEAATSGRHLGEVILRRGSTRRFRHAPIGFGDLSTILHGPTRGFEADFLSGPDTSLQDIYLIVNEVEGLPSGAYYYSVPQSRIGLLKEGQFRQWAAFLGLEQTLPGDASAVVFFLADLRRVLKRYGNRGYRLAQLEAGTIGGKMYLAAYALGLGATGLTFFDDEVVDFFSPHAEGKDAIFMVALGRAARVRSSLVPVPPPYAD